MSLEDSDQYDPNDPKPWLGMSRAEQEEFNARHGRRARAVATPILPTAPEMFVKLVKQNRKTKKRS